MNSDSNHQQSDDPPRSFRQALGFHLEQKGWDTQTLDQQIRSHFHPSRGYPVVNSAYLAIILESNTEMNPGWQVLIMICRSLELSSQQTDDLLMLANLNTFEYYKDSYSRGENQPLFEFWDNFTDERNFAEPKLVTDHDHNYKIAKAKGNRKFNSIKLIYYPLIFILGCFLSMCSGYIAGESEVGEISKATICFRPDGDFFPSFLCEARPEQPNPDPPEENLLEINCLLLGCMPIIVHGIILDQYGIPVAVLLKTKTFQEKINHQSYKLPFGNLNCFLDEKIYEDEIKLVWITKPQSADRYECTNLPFSPLGPMSINLYE